jgi:cellulose synthase/poly-beta-1,6-N-acetylglucosamine synthase-like glycosyltransferase
MSVVITVRDDAEALGRLLDALAAQTRRPDEVIVVDGGSRDGTVELLARWADGPLPLRVEEAPEANIAAGRNAGVRAARHEWIACTDAGCVPDQEWLAALAAAGAGADFVGGVYEVDARTPFERTLAVALYPSVDEIERPSAWVRLWQLTFGRRFAAAQTTGRSMAFTRMVWRAVGGFPERLYAGEDVSFSAAVAASGARTTLAPRALVRWRPRPTWPANVRMYVSYGRGDIRAGRLHRHVLRLVAWTVVSRLAFRPGTGRRVAGACAVAYLSLPLRRAQLAGLPRAWWWRIPLVIAMKDLSQIAGAAVGLLDAARGSDQPRPVGGG